MKKRDREYPMSGGEEFSSGTEYRDYGKNGALPQMTDKGAAHREKRSRFFMLLCTGGIVLGAVMNNPVAAQAPPADTAAEAKPEQTPETPRPLPETTAEQKAPETGLTPEEKALFIELEAAMRERDYDRARKAVTTSVFDEMRFDRKTQWTVDNPVTVLIEDGEVTLTENGTGYGICLRGTYDEYDTIDRYYCGEIKDGLPEGRGVLVWDLQGDRLSGYDGSWADGYAEGADGLAFRYVGHDYGDGTFDVEYHTLTGNFSKSAGDGLLEMTAYHSDGSLIYQCQYLSEAGIIQPGYSVTEEDWEEIVYFLHYSESEPEGNSILQEYIDNGYYTCIPSFAGEGERTFFW